MHRFIVSIFTLLAVGLVTSAADSGYPFPANYREWVFLSSGMDMSYSPKAGEADEQAHTFDNVFVNPEAYRSFLATGTWPDKTVLVLENRSGHSKGSINQAGGFQGIELQGVEIHVKDKTQSPDGWAFYGFGNKGGTGRLFPHSASCYSCHAQHGTVDTTFVQFYPTLLPVAEAKGTFKKDASPLK